MGAKRSLGHVIHLGPSVCPYPSLSVHYLLPIQSHSQAAQLTSKSCISNIIRQTDIRSDPTTTVHANRQQLAARPGTGRQLCMIKLHPPPDHFQFYMHVKFMSYSQSQASISSKVVYFFLCFFFVIIKTTQYMVGLIK
jgi:hypothetical protein